MSEPALNLTAFDQGHCARMDDDDNGKLTDNPYTPETEASRSWYRGYNYEDENPEAMAEMHKMKGV